MRESETTLDFEMAYNNLREQCQKAKILIGATNDGKPEAVKESNINQAWHILDHAIYNHIPTRTT
jgi:hypothetical protein